MDADSPLVSRLERTFWTVWYYISGAVHRLLRPEQENNVSNNPISLQESTADSELAECPHEDGVSGEVQGKQTLETASPLSSSRPAVAWDLCTSEIDLGPDEKHLEYTAGLKDCKTDEEEECIPTGHGESWLLGAKNSKAEKDGVNEEEEGTHKGAETLENEKSDESMITSSQTISKDDIRGDTAGAAEDTERIQAPDIQYVEDTATTVQDQEDDGIHLETDSTDINLSTITELPPEEEVTMHKEEATGHRNLAEAEIPKTVLLSASGDENRSDEDTLKDDTDDFVDGELQMASNTSVPACEDELMVAGLEYERAQRNSNDRSDTVDERMKSPVEQEGQEVVIEDEKVNKAEVPEIQIVTGDSKETINSSAQMWCSDEVSLHADTELHTNSRLKDVVKDISVQIMITEMGDGETESYGAATNEESAVKSSSDPAEEDLFNENQVQEDHNVERVSVTVKPEEETEQDISCEFGNVPEYKFKVQSTVTQGPKPGQGGAPESINEPEPDGNASQRLLGVGDCQEVWITPSPEEVDNQEPESLQNNGDNTEASAAREHTEKIQESKENSESFLGLVGSELQPETKKLHLHTLVQEAGPKSVEENREELVSPMRTGIDDSKKEFESDFRLTSEKDLQDREDILFEMDEELQDPNEAGYAGERFMETESLDTEETVKAGEQMVKADIQDPEDTVSSGQNINKTHSLIENITATEFLEQSATELQLLKQPEQQYVGTGLEKERNRAVQNAAEDEVGPELGSSLKCPETAFSNKEQNMKDKEHRVGSNSGDSELGSDTETSSLTAESGFSEQSLSDWGPQCSESRLLKPNGVWSVQDMFGNVPELESIPKLFPQQLDSECQDTVMRGTDEAGQPYLKDRESVIKNQSSEETKDSPDENPGSQEEINTDEKGLLAKTGLTATEEDDVMPLTKVSSLFRVEENQMEEEALVITLSDSPDESIHTESSCSRNSSDAWSEEGILSAESCLHDDTSVDKLQHNCLEDIQNRPELEDQLTAESEYQSQADGSALDFTAQRSRIAVKNPQVRPPKDPRSLILMSSLEPTPGPPHLPSAKLPLGGMGIGIKLPGLGAGFPGLKKTQQRGKDETRPESDQKESETMLEETVDDPKQDEKQHRRKWMPPRHPGFGNPLMSELKTRLNKTTKD